MTNVNELGITISARDTNTTATIQHLRTELKGLQDLLGIVGGSAADASGKITAGLQTEINAINKEIAARSGQVQSIRTVTGAIKEQNEVSSVTFRTLQENINASLGLDRAMGSAAASARVLTTSLSAAAEADARLRDMSVATTEALARQNATSVAVASRGAGGSSRGRSAAGAVGAADAAIMTYELRHVVAMFDELSRGQHGAFFSTLGAAARDSGMGVAALATSVGGLIAVLTTAAILHHAEALGEWATKLKAGASAAAMSVEDFSALQGALVQTGVKADSADAILRNLAVNVGRALANPASQTAEAFHNLGISQAALEGTGGNLMKVLQLLSDAFIHTADSENKSENMAKAIGRDFEKLIPILQNGRSGFDELLEEARKAGVQIGQDTADKLIHTGEVIHHLAQEIQGNAIKAFTEWGPQIEAVTRFLGGLLNIAIQAIGAIGSAVVATRNAINSVINTLPPMFQAMEDIRQHQAVITSPTSGATVHAAPPGFGLPAGAMVHAAPSGFGRAPAKTDVPPLETPPTVIEEARARMLSAKLEASKTPGTRADKTKAEDKAEIDALKKFIAEKKLTAKQALELNNMLMTQEVALNNAMSEKAGARGDAGAKAARQEYADFAAMEKKRIAEAGGSSAKIIAIYEDWARKAKDIYHQQANVVTNIEREKVQAVNRAKLKEIDESTQEEESENRLKMVTGKYNAIASGKVHYKDEETIGGKGPDTDEEIAGYASQSRDIEASAQRQIAKLKDIMATSEQGTDVYIDAQKKIRDVLIKSKTEEIELYDKAKTAAVEAASESSDSLTKVFDSIGSHMGGASDSLVKAILSPKIDYIQQGLTTKKFSMQGEQIREAIANMLIGAIQDGVKEAESAASQALASMLSEAMNIPIKQGGGLDSLFGSAIKGLFGSGGGASALPNAASFGIAATGLTTAGTGLTASATALSGSATALTASASTSSASGAASSSGGIFSWLLALFEGGGIVPSARGGMIVGGTGGTLAVLHAKEMVLPAHLSHGIQQMIQRNSSTTNGLNNSTNASLNYSPTINQSSRGRGGTGMTRAEFSEMLALHSGSLLGEARSMMRAGWRPA